MEILYIGQVASTTTSGHRFRAIERLGHQSTALDLYEILGTQLTGEVRSRIHYRTGYRLLQSAILRHLREEMSSLPGAPDLIWVNSGELLGARAIQFLKTFGAPVVLYNNDDPSSGRDGRRWDSLIAALPFYDFCAIRLDSDHNFFTDKGAKRIMPVWMSYDEVAHAPDPDWKESEDVDVSFIGTWMRGENREGLLRALHDGGLKLEIIGARWQKSSDPELVGNCWSGKSVSGLEYAQAISTPKITLGMVSTSNRDFHTQRSFEIPYSGGLFCAQRTVDHCRLYKEGEEAVFWSSPEECLEKCRWLLEHPEGREQIRQAGMRRVRALKVGNEDVCRSILERYFDQPNENGPIEIQDLYPVPLNKDV